MAHSIVENVVKQGYLKRGHYGSNRLSGFFRRNDVNKWFVFTIRQGVPYLEYYDSDVDVFTHQPINSFNLSGCQNVKSMGNTNPPSFCIVCLDRVIELVASSRTQMVEWVNDIQASLTRLGVLKSEVVDHVYTVCPAVIRKPRGNKENTDENKTEAVPSLSSQAATAAADLTGQTPSGLADHAPPPKSPPTRQRAKTVKPSLRAALANRSSFHGSTASAAKVAGLPPPLPSRLPSQIVRANTLQERNLTADSDRSEHQNNHLAAAAESSNDSDFVSPEVIAELRRQRLASMRATNSAPSERETEAATASDMQVSLNESYQDSSSDLDHYSAPNRNPQTSAAEALQITEESTTCKSSQNVDHFEELALSSSCGYNVSDGSLPIPDVVENEYSQFPCLQKSSDIEADGVNDNDSSGAVMPKPMPARRKVLPRLCSAPVDLTYELPVSGEHRNTPASAGNDELIVSEETHKKMFASEFEENENPEGEYTTLRTESIETDRSCTVEKQLNVDKDAIVSHSEETFIKQTEPHPTKDENENIYILMSNNCPPPVTLAPPIPSIPPPGTVSSIPPIPPRHDSLQIRNDSSKSLVTQKNVNVLSLDVKNPVSSSSQSSAFSAAASGKHKDLLADVSALPPLPLPRRTNSITDSYSLSASAFTSGGLDETPPMLPRRTAPPLAANQENKPPVLPSRTSQSFFIKRPQITGLSNNMKDSSENGSGHKNAALVPDDNLRSSDNKLPDSGTTTSASSLSRKMLLDHSHSLHTVVSLKQTQAEILQTEISSPYVTLTLTQKSGHGLALVDWNDSPCVAGWNQKDFPSLHGKLHLGDLIISVNNIRVANCEIAQKVLKQATSSKIEVMLQRMPYAKVFAIHRDAEGQSLGIRREGSTGEIIYVDPNGLAAQHGLTSHAQSASDSNTQCNWYLTEINNRPLSLFFKENEIDLRLAAVGREISIVVQPSDFIFEIRRQFKKVKNYKNYIIQ